MTKRAIVTGLSGFIGRQCVEPLLRRGFEVHGLGRTPRPEWLPSMVEWNQVDLLNGGETNKLIAGAKPTHLLNLAWYNVHGSYWRSPVNANWVCAGLSMMDAFTAAGGERFVGAGTCAEYDWRFGFLSEATTPIKPLTPFGQCKAALAQASTALAETHGLSFAWGRVFFVYGPHETSSRLVAAVITALTEGQPVKTADGRQMRDFTHVADIGAAFAALLDSPVTGNVNLGSGRPTPVREVVEALAKLIGRPELVEYGALPLAADEPPLLVADVRRLQEEVGFAPRFGLKEGLGATLEAYRAGGG